MQPKRIIPSLLSGKSEKCVGFLKQAAWMSLSGVLLLTGCNSGSSDKDGNKGPVGLPGDMALREVQAARFHTEDDVVILAPDSLFDETWVGPLRMLLGMSLSMGVDLTGANRGEDIDNCTHSGSIEMLSRQSEDVGSPFTDEEHDVITTRDNDCRQESLGMPFSQRTDGMRRIGYPVSLTQNGSFLTAQDFYAYEQSGSSLTDTFDVESFINWSRWFNSHVHLRRDEQGHNYGDAGGTVHLYHLSLQGTGHWFDDEDEDEWDNNLLILKQVGDPLTEQRLELEFEPVADHVIEENRRERYHGIYGYEWVSSGNSDLSGCPFGRFHVETDGWLDITRVDDDEDDDFESFGSGYQAHGNLTMTDEYGNTALVTHDQINQQMIVQLNGNAPKVYTYSEVDALRVQQMVACIP